MKKRIFALSTILVTLTFAFAACRKESRNDKQNTPPTPTGSVEISLDKLLTTTPSPDTIILGGYFDRENINISIYYTDTWHINGIYYTDSASASKFLSGALSHKGGAELTYIDGSNELSFVFTNGSMTIKSNKGNDYSVFEGYYERKEQAISTEEAISPKSGSTLEFIGRTALTYYLLEADGLLDCMIQPGQIEYNNNLMTNFLLIYTDLFLVSKAEFSENISDRYLCYGFSEDELGRLLSVASNGNFDLHDLNLTDSNIIYNDNTYYVPCYGNFAGGISSRYTSEDPDTIPKQLILDGAITKKDDTMYNIVMTLTTSNDTPLEAIDVNIESIQYKVSK